MTSGDSGDMKHGAREAVTVGPGGSAGETDVDTPVRGQATEERIVLPWGTGQTGDEAVSPSAASGGRGRTFVRVALLGLVGVALAGFWFAGGSDLLTLERLRASHDTLVSIYRESPVASVLVFSLVYVAATALSFPGAAVLTLGGASVFGFWVSLVAVSFASTVGATLAFMGARYVFRDWVARRFMEPMRRVEGAAGRQHGVEDDSHALVDVLGELGVVLHRFEGLLVAEHAHHADLGTGNHIQEAVEHAETGAQDGHGGDLLALYLVDLDRPGPTLYADLLRFEVLRGLVGEKTAEFVGDGPEFAHRDIMLAQAAQLVFDQRMVDDVNSHGCLLGRGTVTGASEPQTDSK